MVLDPHAARQDRSLDLNTSDALDRGPFIRNLVNSLVRVDIDNESKKRVRATGFTVGLSGKWGSGKSSVLFLLGEELGRMDRVVVSTFNPWLFKGRDELVQAYFNGLRAALGRSPSDQIKELQEGLDRYRTAIDFAGGTIALYADLHGASGTASRGWQTVKNWLSPKPRSPDEERAALEAKIKKANVAVVVLIDELDRVEDEEVRAVAQLVKAVGDIKGISYLVAYDHDRVADALGRGGTSDERLRSGSVYLEKIIQFAVPLRPLFSEDVSRLLDDALDKFGISLPPADRKHQTEIMEALVNVLHTPREIKRLVGSFAVYEEVVHGEICSYDVLAYSWLATRLPTVRQRIADEPDAVVDDPNTSELMRRMGSLKERPSKEELLERALGPLSEDQRRLMTLLFPTFQESSIDIAGDRLSKRRNLVRLLFLGDPPGSIARREIEAVWSLPSPDAVMEALRPFRDAERLREFLQRLGDLLPTLSQEGDRAFWSGLSRSLLRSHDWIETAESLGDAADDAGQMLWNLGTSDLDQRTRVLKIMTKLNEDGDLLIVPFLIRRNFSRLGMGVYREARSDDALMTRDEALDVIGREELRFREAITSGHWLRRVPDAELLYVLPNLKRWDDELRSNLTNLLSSMKAIATFAVLTVRPGYISSYESMDELLDADVIASRITEMVHAGGLPEDPYLAVSVRRLQATLTNRDPHWMDGSRQQLDEIDSVLFPGEADRMSK
jgi:hypothetical protein